MRNRGIWFGVVFLAAVLAVPVLLFLPRDEGGADHPWDFVASATPATDHSVLMEGPFPNGPSVTRACLKCHPDAAAQVIKTSHWRWESDPVLVPGHPEPMAIGKKNLINNFCISVQSNWFKCTSCHVGYGWVDETFDFNDTENVDCLVCHDGSGTYVKADGGQPAEGVDLLAVAKSVRRPSRENCGGCHFSGGGGDAVKHGDLDQSLIYPRDRVDVHMGKHKMICTDCHRAVNHLILGRSISVSVDHKDAIACTDCHAGAPHDDERINLHTGSVA